MSEAWLLASLAEALGHLRQYRDLPTQVVQVFALVAANDLSGGLPLPMKTVQDLADMPLPSISRTVATLTGVGYLQNGKRVGGLDWVQTTNDITDLKAKLLMLSPPGREGGRGVMGCRRLCGWRPSPGGRLKWVVAQTTTGPRLLL